MFAGGMLGEVTNAKNEKTLMVKIADGVKVEISRGAVNAILEKGEEPGEIPGAV
jgi:preprotein translocase subunit YajC